MCESWLLLLLLLFVVFFVASVFFVCLFCFGLVLFFVCLLFKRARENAVLVG